MLGYKRVGEFFGQRVGVIIADTKRDESSDIAEDGLANLGRELVNVLM